MTYEQPDIKHSNFTADLLDRLPASVCVFSYDGKQFRCIHRNSYSLKIFPAHSDENGTQESFTPQEDVFTQDRQAFYGSLLKAWETDEDFSASVRILTQNDGYRWFDVKVSVTEGFGGTKYFYIVYTDIDESVKLQNRLKLSEHIKNLVLENQNLVVWRYDPLQAHNTMLAGGDKRYVEPEADDVPYSLIKNHMVAVESSDEYIRLHKKAAAGERAGGRIRLFDPKLKSFRWRQLSFIPMLSDSGQFLYSIGCAADINDKVEEEILFNARICSVSAVNKNAIGVFRFNLTKNLCFGGYSKFDKVMQMQEKGTVDGFYEYGYSQIPTEKEREAFKQSFSRTALLKAYESGRTTLTADHRTYDEKEEIVWVNTTVELAKNPATGDIEGVTYSVNITQSKTLESILSIITDIDYDRITVMDARSGVETDLHGGYIIGTQQRSRLSSRSEFRQYLMDNIINDGEENAVARVERSSELEHVKKQLETQPIYRFAFSVRDFDGQARRKYFTYAYLDENKTSICCIQHDITDIYTQQKRQNERLAAALEDARRANAAKSEFLSRMSHEIRTPMNAIIGMSDFGIDESSGSSADYFKKIKSSSVYLLGILNDILDMSRIENDKITLYPESYSLENFAENVNTIIAPLMQKKDIDFRFELHDIYADELMLDKQRINQIFINLLSNSAKFTPEKGRVDFTIYQMPSSSDSVRTVFTVCDNGIGMSEDFLSKLFEPFTQERNAATSSIQGTGLGLAISKNLIELMGGSITVKSKLGEGTSITAEIDCEPAALRSSCGDNTPTDKFDFSGRRALIVEDNSINRILAVKVLKKAGFETDTAVNGFEGLKKFIASATDYYDIVLMDIRMPVMDGLEAAKKIRELDRADSKTVPIVAMSANAYPEDFEKSKAAGMNSHVAKPVVPSLLYAEIHKALKRTKDSDI